MPFLTIFTAPKPFTNPHIAIIQGNAIQSWVHLGPEVEVCLIGEESGLAEAATRYGVRHLPNVARNKEGTPLVSSIFQVARENSTSPLLAYVNADILLLSDFIRGAQSVFGGKTPDGRLIQKFLLVGRRWNLNIRENLDFSSGWEEYLRSQVTASGTLQSPHGSDHFIFPRSMFTDIPDFAVGRAGWDNWMIYHALSQGWLVADTTPAMLVIHQDHDYSHLPSGQIHHHQAESDQNVTLGGGKSHMSLLLDVNYVLENGKIRRTRLSLSRILRKLELALMPKDFEPTGWRRYIIGYLRRWRVRRKAKK